MFGSYWISFYKRGFIELKPQHLFNYHHSILLVQLVIDRVSQLISCNDANARNNNRHTRSIVLNAESVHYLYSRSNSVALFQNEPFFSDRVLPTMAFDRHLAEIAKKKKTNKKKTTNKQTNTFPKRIIVSNLARGKNRSNPFFSRYIHSRVGLRCAFVICRVFVTHFVGQRFANAPLWKNGSTLLHFAIERACTFNGFCVQRNRRLPAKCRMCRKILVPLWSLGRGCRPLTIHLSLIPPIVL